MDAYKEMTCSNQAREDDALFLQEFLCMMEKTPHTLKDDWILVKQVCNMTDRKLRKELMKKLNWSHQGNTLHDKPLLD